MSDRISSPRAVGFLGPAVILPLSLPEQLTESEFDQIVLHELAHLRRHDDWTNLAQKVLEALFPFHPAVLWIARRLDLEREMACDECVVAVTREARPYAACLTRLVELTGWAHRSSLAA